MTVALGVNDDEIGAVIKRALDTPYVGGVTHPAGRSGRVARRASTRSTGSPTPACSPGSSGQTGGQVTWRDLTALPCSHPHCCSVGYLLRDDARHVALADRADRPRPAQGVARPAAGRRRQPDRRRRDPRARCGRSSRTRCSACCRSSRRCRTPTIGAALERHLRELRPRHRHAAHPRRRRRCPASRKRLRQLLGERVLRVTVKPFMDMSTMIEERLPSAACTWPPSTSVTGAHQCAPFCAVQAWAPLSRTRISTATGGRSLLEVTSP